MEEKQNIFERIKLYLFKPSEFFQKYKENPKYIFHLIILSIIACASALISKYVNASALNELMNESMSNLSQSQIEANNNAMGLVNSPIVTVLFALIGTVAGYYIVSAIYYLIIGKIFKGEGTFNQMMIVVLLSSYVVNIYQLVKSFIPINYNIDSLSTISITDTVNIFTIWQLVLMIIGTSVLFNISKKKSGIIFIVLFIISTLFALRSVLFLNSVI
ncbi:MAG: Yip1 family protein [Eubacteriaceae bacterium]